MENQKSLKKFIESSQGILILISKNPYLDQVAAALSLYLVLKDQDKKVSIASPTPMVVEHNRLIGVNKVVSEIGDKNLVIRFKNYNAQNIERVTYDIDKDSEEFKLSVIPKPNVSAPTEDQLDIKYSGISADTVILVGGANESHFPDLSNNAISSAKVAHIGKQDVAGNSSRTIVSFAEHRASVSELMADYLREFTSSFNKDIATNLLAGIKEGTRDFSHTSVNAKTFELAAELMRAGGDAGADYNQGNRNGSSSSDEANPQMPATEKEEKLETTESDQTTQNSSEEAPASWLEPKIFKGTTSK